MVAGVALLIVFSFAFSWIWTMFGLLLRTEKSVMGVSMMVIFPLTFLSNVFVDPKTMPGWLQAFVNNSPVTHLASAVRGADGGRVAGRGDRLDAGLVGACSCWSSGRSRCGSTTASRRRAGAPVVRRIAHGLSGATCVPGVARTMVMSRSVNWSVADGRIVVAEHPMPAYDADHQVVRLPRPAPHLGLYDRPFDDVEPAALLDEVLHHHAGGGAEHGEPEQPAGRARAGDDGVGAGLLQQRRVLLLAHGGHDLRPAVELAGRQRDEDGRVVALRSR